jgi:putative transcriptional regulator
VIRCWILALSLLAAAASAQQAERPNGLLLIAKPQLSDPNFGRSVVLVTQASDGGTVGVILNRPLGRTHSSGAPIFFGGPVMQEVIVALFHSEQTPGAPAFHVLKGVYLSMHPGNVDPLLEGRGGGRHRVYMGFSGWAPGQLDSEMQRDGWYVLPASEEILFRADTAGMWDELVSKVRGKRAENRPTIPQSQRKTSN